MQRQLDNFDDIDDMELEDIVSDLRCEYEITGAMLDHATREQASRKKKRRLGYVQMTEVVKPPDKKKSH